MEAASAFGNGIDGPARWSLRLLGDFQLTDRESGEKVALPGKRERVLLAYLALSPNGRQSRRKLVTLLWGEAADETTLENLRTTIFNMRKALGDTEHRIVASEDRDILLDASAFDVDVLEFRRLTAGPGSAELEEGARLYAGDFLDDLSIESEEFESWRREESTRCKGQVLDALTRLMGQLAAAGENDRAIEAGLRSLRLEPMHEGAVRSLMRLYAESGRRAAAVELYRTFTESLKKELGAQPDAETRAVLAEIARGNEGQIAAVAGVQTPPPTTMVHSVPPPAEHFGAAVGSSPPIARLSVNRHRFGWWAGGLAAAAVAVLLFVTLAPATGPAQRGGPATVVAATPTSAIALAVLPFANLSAEPDQDFFSDGLTDEIASALARVPDLRTVARTSAFEFKGQNRNIRTIGEQLGATHLIEGSVRRAGDRVRITVQLIRADDGIRIWSNDYDRQLTDIFAIQEDIARAVASSLSVPLGLQQGENLVSNRDIDPESYQQYLGARAIIRTVVISGGERRIAAIGTLEQVVARYPGYAPAWAQLALGYYRRFNIGLGRGTVERRRAKDEFLPKAEAAARRAIELDANLADGYPILATIIQVRRLDLVQADELYSKALALDPFHPEALHFYAYLLGGVGRVKEALAMREQLIVMEPFAPISNDFIEELRWIVGQTDTVALMERLRAVRTRVPPARAMLARIYAEQGRYTEAVDALMAIPHPGRYTQEAVDAAVRLLRTAPAAATSSQNLPRLANNLEFAYLHVGAPELVLQPFEDDIAADEFPVGDMVWLWHPSYAPARKTERFKAFARNAGLVEYWRAKGWPEVCRPVGADDFVCE